MAIVKLQILEPADGQTFEGTGNVHMRGAVTDGQTGPLFFKWYSNLAPAPIGTMLDFMATLGVGSHTVSFVAKDRFGDGVADLQAVKEAGMAGGPEKAEHPCRFHVFLASIVNPALPPATLSIANGTLEAGAPSQWASPDYQDVNKIRYRWLFASGSEITGPLAFDATGPVPVVRYQGALPSGLSPGNATIRLRVEHADDPSIGHEVSRGVLLTA